MQCTAYNIDQLCNSSASVANL